MKKSRIIIIVSALFILGLSPIYYFVRTIGIEKDLCMNIITNLSCGIIVALVTATCQYFISKRKIVNDVYGLYFDLYRTYYYSKNKVIFFHVNAYSIYKKMIDLSTKINEALEGYHGFFKAKDSLYTKMNPEIKLNESYKVKKIIGTLFKWFNRKTFNETVEPFIMEIEKILKCIDEKRFNKDKDNMIKMFNYIWN